LTQGLDPRRLTQRAEIHLSEKEGKMILARRALIALPLVISGVAGFIYCLLFKAPLPSEGGTRDLPGL
jgi:hypothetical protein